MRGPWVVGGTWQPEPVLAFAHRLLSITLPLSGLPLGHQGPPHPSSLPICFLLEHREGERSKR